MFCMSCGKQLEDNSKFCPYCGATVEEAAAPAAQTVNEAAEKPAKKPSKKFPVGLIAAVAVIAIVVVAVIALIGGGSPSAKVMAAFGKTIGEYTAVAEDMIPTNMAGFLKDGTARAALRCGAAAGTSSVMTEGTQLIVPEDYERLLPQVQIREL